MTRSKPLFAQSPRRQAVVSPNSLLISSTGCWNSRTCAGDGCARSGRQARVRCSSCPGTVCATRLPDRSNSSQGGGAWCPLASPVEFDVSVRRALIAQRRSERRPTMLYNPVQLAADVRRLTARRVRDRQRQAAVSSLHDSAGNYRRLADRALESLSDETLQSRAFEDAAQRPADLPRSASVATSCSRNLQLGVRFRSAPPPPQSCAPRHEKPGP